MIEAKSDHDYNYKNEVQIWKDNKEFDRQICLIIRPPLYLTIIGTNTTDTKISHLDSTPVGTKIPDPNPLIRPTELSKRKWKLVKEYVPEDPESDP